MKSPSIRIYEEMMRKLLLNNLFLLFAVGLTCTAQPVFAGSRAAFLMFSDGIDLSVEVSRLEDLGARVRQRVPPRILIADLPEALGSKPIPSAQTVYFAVVPLSVLEPMGPLAVAAGMQWNRRMLLESKSAGKQSLGAMRAQVAQKSLPAPTHLTVTENGSSIRLAWEASTGALYYEVEAALDSNFADRFSETRTSMLETRVPLPAHPDSTTVYLRVRGADHADGEHKVSDDVLGAWSQPVSLMVRGKSEDALVPAPTPTSPLDRYLSQGFTLILEWTGGTSPLSRVQVSRSEKFNGTLFDIVAEGGEFICPSPALHLGDTLYWRVRDWGDKQSPWSSVRSFTIGNPHNEGTDMFINPEAPR